MTDSTREHLRLVHRIEQLEARLRELESLYPFCLECGKDMEEVVGGFGARDSHGRLWCGCPSDIARDAYVKTLTGGAQ